MTRPRRVSRRRFLRGAALALAAPYMLTGRARGRTAPEERINVGLIGAKKMGGEHLRNLLRFRDVQLVAVCDVDSVVREAAARTVNQHYAAMSGGAGDCCTAHVEFEELLARPDVDAVLIATPDHWHAPMAIAACRAGKDVYCEKPLSLTVRQAQAMVAAARRHSRVFQTGTQQRSSAEFRRAVELVRNGYIGELRRVHVEVGPCSEHIEMPEEPVPPGFDYPRWLGPAPWAPYHPLRVGSYYFDGWRRFRDYSGGKMTDWGAHHFDIAQWGLGMDESGPVEIVPVRRTAEDWLAWKRGFATRRLDGPGATPDDPSWGLTYRYANGVEVIKDGTNGIRFVGTTGEVQVNRGFLRTLPGRLASVRFGPNDRRVGESDNHVQNWLDCIHTRGRPISDVAIAARSVSVCHLGNIALWLNRPIRWDPQAEQLIGDDQAARWLERPGGARA